MPAQMLLLGNPSGRRRRRHAKRAKRRHRSKTFTVNPHQRRVHRRARRRHSAPVMYANPRRRSRRAAARRMGLRAAEILKAGTWGGAGALTIDLVMGTVGQMLPAALSQPTDATSGATNWGYYGTKGALALGLAMFGSKVMPPKIAAEMGAGAVTVVAYQIFRGLIPAGTLPLGAWFNPAPIIAPSRAALPGAARPMGGVTIPLHRPGIAGVRMPVAMPFRRPNQ